MQPVIQTILKRNTRRFLLRRCYETAVLFAAISAAFCGLIMLFVLLSQLALPLELWILPVISIPAGVIAGTCAAGIKGAKPIQTAMFLDARYKLQEKLTTAAELLEKGDHTPVATCVYDQAKAAFEQIPAGPSFKNIRKKQPAVTAAFLLAVMFCCLLALFPNQKPLRPTSNTDEIKQLVAAISEMSPDSQIELAQAFSTKTVSNEKVAGELENLALAIRAKDQAEQERIFAALTRAGYKPVAILPDKFRQEISATTAADSANFQNPASLKNRDNSGKTAPPKTQPTPPGVYIHHPDYADTSHPAEEKERDLPAHFPPPAEADPEWSAVKARAAKNSQPHVVPLAYRTLLKQFYRK